MTAPDERGSGFLGGLADEAERFVKVRIDRLAHLAQERGNALADSVGERVSRHLVDQLSRQFAVRLALTGVAVGSLIVGVGLLALGMAGALGETFGKPWMGQLAAGGITLLVVAAAWGIARDRQTRRAESARQHAAERGAQSSAPQTSRTHAATEVDPEATDTSSSQAVTAGVEFLHRHPLAGAAAVSALALLGGVLVARSNERSDQHD